MLLPTAFDLTELLDLLKPRLSLFNIHARQLSGSLYTLDLAKCYDFLTEIRNVQESGKFELRDFIDNKLLKASDWLKCVTEPCSISESLVSSCLIKSLTPPNQNPSIHVLTANLLNSRRF